PNRTDQHAAIRRIPAPHHTTRQLAAHPRLCHHHASPTRRSSDLWSLSMPLDGFTLAEHAELAREAERLGYTDAFGLARQLGVLGDRKSTRLNSSHVSISYAVFCLKKKNYCKAVVK